MRLDHLLSRDVKLTEADEAVEYGSFPGYPSGLPVWDADLKAMDCYLLFLSLFSC